MIAVANRGEHLEEELRLSLERFFNAHQLGKTPRVIPQLSVLAQRAEVLTEVKELAQKFPHRRGRSESLNEQGGEVVVVSLTHGIKVSRPINPSHQDGELGIKNLCVPTNSNEMGGNSWHASNARKLTSTWR